MKRDGARYGALPLMMALLSLGCSAMVVYFLVIGQVNLGAGVRRSRPPVLYTEDPLRFLLFIGAVILMALFAGWAALYLRKKQGSWR